MSTHRLARLATALVIASAAGRPADGQQRAAAVVVTLRIDVTGERAAVGASGVLPFATQGQNAVLSVVAADSAGQPVSLAGAVPRWTTSDAATVSLYGSPAGSTMRVVAQRDGRATVTVSVLGKTASIPVVVGRARQEIAAAELTPAFRVARLDLVELQPGPQGRLAGRALTFGRAGENAVIGARAFAADGREIPLDAFPVTWTTTAPDVVELFQTHAAQTRVVGRAVGRSTVSASVQGVTVALEGFVGDAATAAADPALTAATASVSVVREAGERPTSPAIAVPAGAAAGATATTAPRPTATALGRVPGAAPTNVVATATRVGTVLLTWTPAAGASGHTIATSTGADGPFVQLPPSAVAGSRTLVLRPGTYHVTVTATYAERPAGISEAVVVTVPPASQPTGFRAVSGPGYVQLSWDSIPQAVGYTIARVDGGVAVPLDDHFPVRPSPRVRRRSFIDTGAPDRAVGYVLSAIYSDASGEYPADSTTLPRVLATPRPLEPSTTDSITLVKYAGASAVPASNTGNPLIATFTVLPGLVPNAWIKWVTLEKLQPTGWQPTDSVRFHGLTTDGFQRRSDPLLPLTHYIWLVYDVRVGCEHTLVWRLRVTWVLDSQTGGNVPTFTRLSRPMSVSYDSPRSVCP